MVDKLRLEGKAILLRSTVYSLTKALEGDLNLKKVNDAYEYYLQVQEELLRLRIALDAE